MYSPPVAHAPMVKLPQRLSKRLPWDSVLITLASLVILGAIAFLVMSRFYAATDAAQSRASAALSPSPAAQAVQRPTLFIDRILNVSQPNVQANPMKLYLRVSMAVEFADPSGAFSRASGLDLGYLERNFAADHSAALEVFNDIVTTTIDTKTPAELWTAEGKESLRQELIVKFNQALAGTNDRVVYINFTDFVMQSTG